MSDREKIMKRLSEHLEAVRGKHPEWVGIFLQGSQNYNLDYEGSDIDSKLIVLPSFEDFVLNKRPYSYTHIMENDEHVDVKDIRLMLDCFKKQNVNFVEILFTPYRILNPKYEALFQPILDIAERVGRYNNYAALNCMVGMALEKQKALCHPYPALISTVSIANSIITSSVFMNLCSVGLMASHIVIASFLNKGSVLEKSSFILTAILQRRRSIRIESYLR